MFIIFINDIETGITSTLSKFADDCKIKRTVKSDEDANAVQVDLNNLVMWSHKWQMKFHPDKCKVLHIGHNNQRYKYYIEGTEVKKVSEEKDLGVITSEDLKQKKQVAKVVKSANRILGMIRRTITCKNKINILSLYKTLVRPILDYGAAVWSPHQRGDIEKVEKIQRRATKMIKEIRHLSYQDRLKACNLMTLEMRRRRYDLIETFKIIKEIYAVDKEKFFKMRNNQTRGHNQKIYKQHSRLNLRKYFFTQRVVNDWNQLPEEAVNATTVTQFKTVIDSEFKEGGLYMIQ